MNKPISKRNIILNILPFLLGLIVFSIIKISARHPEWVENIYSRGIYPTIAGVVSAISSVSPVSLWDMFWIFMTLFVLTGLVRVFMRKLNPGRYFLRLFQGLAMLYSLFYLLWGFNYFRPGIDTRLGWGGIKPDENSFRQVLDSLIAGANRTFTTIDAEEYGSLDEAIENSYNKCSDILAISYPNGSRTPKTILVSSYFAKSGVSGYFGPFFNEVHINHYQLPVDYPFVIAHEKAHQFGFANEAEANLSAFIICTNSDDLRLQYSGFMHLLIYFLNEARDMQDYGAILSKIDKQVIKDILNREKYYDRLRNKKMEKVQNAANDVYLKTQHIEKGIKNYDQVVALAINWYAVTGKLPLKSAEDIAGTK